MERRHLMFMGLAGALGATLGLAGRAQAVALGGAASAVAPAVDRLPEAEDGDGIQLAQYRGYGPGSGRNRRRRRCWNETRNVRYRDRFGRMRVRQVTQRVCR